MEAAAITFPPSRKKAGISSGSASVAAFESTTCPLPHQPIAGVTNKGVAARSVLAGLKYSTDDWANAYTLGPNDLVVQPAAYADGNVRESLSFQLPVTVPTASAFRVRTRLIGQNGDIEVHAATDGVSSMVVWLIQG